MSCINYHNQSCDLIAQLFAIVVFFGPKSFAVFPICVLVVVFWILISLPLLNIKSYKANFLRRQSICYRNGAAGESIF